MADLRRAATPLGLLPERVDARTGAPRSTTPLTWSHAFAILALRELWPGRAVAGRPIWTP
jgi:GH15 family glucan-1,4-alpha-glucosidase